MKLSKSIALAAIVFALALFLFACDDDGGSEACLCGADSDCPVGQYCVGLDPDNGVECGWTCAAVEDGDVACTCASDDDCPSGYYCYGLDPDLGDTCGESCRLNEDGDATDGDLDGDLDEEMEDELEIDGDLDAEADDEIEAELEDEGPDLTGYWPADERGPYHSAGFLTTFYDAERDRELTGTVWYPTLATEGEMLKYQGWFPYGDSFTDVPIGPGGPFPLIVFSHGHQAFDAQTFFLMEYLASHGYIVAACDHIDDTLGTMDVKYMIKSGLDRPQDLSLMIDTLLEWNATDGHLLHGQVDETRIGASGHSFGAHTAIAVLGPRLDFDAVMGVCEDLGASNWRGEWWICKDLMQADPTYADFCLPNCAFGDERILASVPMSAPLPDSFDPDSIAALDIPMLLMAGTTDDTVPLQTQTRRFFDWATQEDTMLWKLEKGGHMTFSNMCLVVGTSEELGCGERFIDPERAEVLINTGATAFFGLHVKGEPRYYEYFEAAYLNTAPEVEIEYMGNNQ